MTRRSSSLRTRLRNLPVLVLASSLAAGPAPAPGAAQAAPPVQTEIERVQKKQALHTLAGIGRALREGQDVDVSKRPALVRSLDADARRSAARLGSSKPLGPREFDRLAAPGRTPRTTAPSTWSEPSRPQPVPKQKGSTLLSFSGQSGGTLLSGPPDPDLAPTVDAQSDHPAIVRKALELGHDPIRIFNFVQGEIVTELYAGSKKGALGTLRERAGNDVDQASLLVALFRASGIPTRYVVGSLALTPAQANEYAGTRELSVSSSLLSAAGVPNAFVSLGAGRGIGLSVEHTWVRASVPATAYRGVRRPGAVESWAHLAPALKRMRTHDAVDLRDAVPFDFDAYLSGPNARRPAEAHEGALLAYIGEHAITCETLDSATPHRRIVPDDLALLPSELPARRLAELATLSALPGDLQHGVRVSARTSQGVEQLAFEMPMAALWGRSVSLVYEPASETDAQIIESYGGLEETPAWRIKLRAVLKIDSATVAEGAAETPGLDQRIAIDTSSPATGLRRVEHALVVGGVYAFALDPGRVPSDLVDERVGRYASLSGDDLEAEKLYVTALTYFHDLTRSRDRIAGLFWHRTYKEVEEAAAMIVPRVEELRGVPVRISRNFFTFDAPGIQYGEFSIDGDHHRSVALNRLIGFESSVLEHRMGERFRGPKAFSAVKLLQIAQGGGVDVVSFDQSSVDAALAVIAWPAEREASMRDFANRGYTVQAPVVGHFDTDLGDLFGFIATDPATGVGGYIVGTVRGEVRGAEGQNGASGTAVPGCGACGETGSPVHLLSGNLPLTFTDLTLPARGIPLAFTRSYNTRGGWTHNFLERLEPALDGSLLYVDAMGIEWRFEADTLTAGRWTPPPKLHQTVEATATGFVMRFKDGFVHRFDTSGRLIEHEDLNGHLLALDYDSGRLIRVTGEGGGYFTFGYDGFGHLAAVSDSAGRSVGFIRDARGNIERENDVLGRSRTYSYDGLGRMLTRSDFRGNEWRYGYDDLGRIVHLEDPLGGIDSYAYDFENRLTVHTDRRGHPLLFELDGLAKIVRRVDPLGNETRATWDERGNKTSDSDARGNTTYFEYDDDGNLLLRIDALGAMTSFVYGANARLVETTDAFGGRTTNRYDTNGNLLQTTDALDGVTTYTYTPDGLPETITRPGGAVTTMTYDDVGNVLSMTDPEGGTTQMGYDNRGNLVSTTDPEGASRTMEVDPKGQLLEIEDALGFTTTFEYDEDGNRTKVIDSDFEETTFDYDDLSRLIATTDALGHVTRQEYDAEGNQTARIDARGFRSTMRYDAVGRLIESCDALGHCTTLGYCAELGGPPRERIDALGNVTRSECDELGRETSQTDALGNTTTTVFDALGRRESVTDPAGGVTTFGYDDLGRLTSVTDAEGGITEYGYDARGNRTSVQDANSHITTFDYDLADRLVRETTPLGAVTEYAYSLSGNRTSKVDANSQVTTFVYDDGDRLAEIHYDGGSMATFGYDGHGRRVFESNADSTREMSYDALGRLTTVVDIESGRWIDYEYDAAGNRTSMRVSPDEDETTYAWDGRGSLIRLTDPDGGDYRFAYDELGRRRLTTYPNGMARSDVYDAASRVEMLTYRSRQNTVVESFGYDYDERGNRTAKVFADGSSERYGYDALSRLTHVAYPTGRETGYVFDAVGNRLQMLERRSGSGCEGDADCDGVPDDADNCSVLANPDQADVDAGSLPAGTSGAWRFEEGSGTTVLDSAGSMHGTLVNGATRSTGPFGGAIHFTDEDDRVNGPSAFAAIADSFTIELWARPEATHTVLPESTGGTAGVGGQRYAIFPAQGEATAGAGHSGVGISVATNGVQVVEHAISFVPAVLVHQQVLNDWTHVVVVYEAGEPRLYLDGALVRVGLRTSKVKHPSAFIGSLAWGNFRGDLDEVAVYDRALSEEEVAIRAGQGVLGDGLGDACDPCPLDADLTCSVSAGMDRDGDSHPDLADNCPTVPNADQENSDAVTVDARAGYRFEETSGSTATDALGGDDNAQLVNGAERTDAGRYGQGLSLPVTSAAVSVPHGVIDGAGDVTLETWLRTTDQVFAVVSGAHALNPNEYLLYAENGLIGTFIKGANIAHAIPALSDGLYHHLAWVRFATGQSELYFDGVFVGAATLPAGALDVDAGGLFLGQDQDCLGGCLDANQALLGELDDVVLWRRALSEAEVAEHARAGVFGDALGDACDGCPLDPNPECGTSGVTEGDGDGDGILDLEDNCAGIANVEQTDSDAVGTDATSVWKLDERSGTSALDSEGGNPGTLVGGPARVEGQFGRGLEFDGVDDRVRVPDAASLKPTTALTLEVWVYPMAFGVQHTLLAKGQPSRSGYQLYLDGSGRIAFNLRVTGGLQQGTSTQALALNRWQHVAVTFDSTRPSGQQSRVYIDGERVTQTAVSAAAGSIMHEATELTFGEGEGGQGERFRGRLDEVGLWARALSDEEMYLHGAGGLYGDRRGDACDACPFNVDPECAPLTCQDEDGDGYGPQGASSCYGHFAEFDCDDEDASIHPGAVEVCDGVDNDCDGVTDEGCLVGAVVTSYEYNAFNQLVSVTAPGGASTTFTYDDNGNQTRKAEPLAETTYVYDARDRLIEVRPPASTQVCVDDADCDLVSDGVDNCPEVVNTGQTDSDRFVPQALSGWSFEEASGTTAEDSFGEADGVLLNGATRTTSGRVGKALSLDGQNDYVEIDNGSSLFLAGRSTFSFEMWVNLDTLDSVASGSGGYLWASAGATGGFESNGSVTFLVGEGSFATAAGVLGIGQWYHVVFVKTGAMAGRIYVNGILRASGTLGTSSPVESQDLNLGFGRTLDQRNVDGRMDEVVIYPGALSAAEVARRAALVPNEDGKGDACDACPVDANPSCGLATCTDTDGDGYGIVGAAGCVNGPALDCNAGSAAVHPGAPELANGLDDDCDGRVDDGAAQVLRFGYDTQGLRVRVADGSGARRILLDGIEEYAEYAASGAEAARYAHDPSRVDALLGQVAGGTKVHAVTDALGSVYALTDGSGSVASKYQYDVYGERTASVEGVPTKWGFTGRVHESGVEGAMYYRARYYDAGSGRFGQTDPLSFAAIATGGLGGRPRNDSVEQLRRAWAAIALAKGPQISISGSGGSGRAVATAVPGTGFARASVSALQGRYLYVANTPVNFVDPSGMALSDLNSDPSYGTTDCTHYSLLCDESGCRYYCTYGVRYCSYFGNNPMDNCIRLCLQDYDNERCTGLSTGMCSPDQFQSCRDGTACNRDGHYFCYRSCGWKHGGLIGLGSAALKGAQAAKDFLILFSLGEFVEFF